MTLTVLGCFGGLPAPGGATSGYLVSEGYYHLLIECGSGVVSRLQEYIEIRKLNAVLISHYHYDHFCDFGVLQYARLVHSQIGERMGCLPIYAPDCNATFFQMLSAAPYTKGIAYTAGKALKIGPFSLSFFRCDHPIECYAMRIRADGKSIFYTADTAYSSYLVQAARDCDLLIADSSLYPNHDGTVVGHMSSVQAAKMATDAQAKELLLSHLPAYGDRQALLRSVSSAYNGPASLAESGCVKTI